MKVLNVQAPVEGKALKVVTFEAEIEKEVGVEVTGPDGIARFDGIPPGHYFLQTADGHGDAAELQVSPSGTKDDILLKWPEMPVLSARQARGRMRLASDFSSVSATASLLEAISLKEVAKGKVNGSFDLGSVPDGLYLLRIDEGEKKKDGWMKLEGDIAVQVDNASNKDELDVDMGMSSCGLYYSESCKHSKRIVVNGLCGAVTDSEGAAIARTRVQLVSDENGQALSLETTRRDGKFHLEQEIPEGRYTLRFLPDSGFTRLDVPVEFHNGSCSVHLQVRLGIMSECGSATLKQR